MGIKIDHEIKKLIEECTERTRGLAKEHEAHINALSE